MTEIDGGKQERRAVQPEDVSLGGKETALTLMMASALGPGRDGLPQREDLFSDPDNLPEPVIAFRDMGHLCLLVNKDTLDVISGRADIAGQEEANQ